MRKRTCMLVLALTIMLSIAFPVLARQADGGAVEQSVVTRLQRAATLIASHDLKGAEAELSAIIKVSPREARALNMMGVVRAEQGRIDEAEDYFKNALIASPRIASAHVNLGLLYMAKDRIEDAANQFDEALRIDPARNDAVYNLILALRRLAAQAMASGEQEKALAHLIRAKSLVDSDADVLFEFAMVAIGLSLYEDAQKALTLALDKRPREPRMIYALARARLATGEVTEAERLFARYVELRPDDATGHYGLGYALALLRRGAEAARSFNRSLELRPEQTESQYQMGLLAYADGDVDGAAQWYEKVLSRYANHTGALVGRGLVHFNRKEYDLARVSFERVVSLDPSIAKAHYHLGLTLARLGDKQAAAREAEIADNLERQQKQKSRVVLRLLDGEPPSSAQKP